MSIPQEQCTGTPSPLAIGPSTGIVGTHVVFVPTAILDKGLDIRMTRHPVVPVINRNRISQDNC